MFHVHVGNLLVYILFYSYLLCVNEDESFKDVKKNESLMIGLPCRVQSYLENVWERVCVCCAIL